MLQQYKANIAFDSPTEPKESKFGGPDYRSLAINLQDPGAPGVTTNDYGEHRAYITFNVGSELEGYLESLSRGDEITVVWDTSGKTAKYQPIVEQSKLNMPVSSEAKSAVGGNVTHISKYSGPQRNSTAPARGGLYNERDIMSWEIAIGEAVDILSRAHSMVSRDPVLGELPSDTQQKYAVTAYIDAGRRWHTIRPEALQQDDGGDAVVERSRQNPVEIILNSDPSQFPGTLLDSIAFLVDGLDDVNDVAGLLKKFGYSRADIDPDNPDTWVFMYNVADVYMGSLRANGGDLELAKRETLNYIAGNVTVGDSVPF